MTFDQLYEKAKAVAIPRKLSEHADCGGVGAALLCEDGACYTGICVDTSCSEGFCAERAAAGDMLKHGQSKVLKMVAVDWAGRILPPCGVCREFISQLHVDNASTEVLVAEGVVLRLYELLPHDWKAVTRKNEES